MNSVQLPTSDQIAKGLLFPEEPPAVCASIDCEEPVVWMAIWSCGHALPYCQKHHVRLSHSARIECSISHAAVWVHLLRWEKI